MTLGSGQPYFPGYFVCSAKDEIEARGLTSKALNNRWCGTHRTIDEVHRLDRIYRGYIDENGIHEAKT